MATLATNMRQHLRYISIYYIHMTGGYLAALGNSTGKNNRFPFLDILGYLKNTHKNPKFGRVRHVPTRELGCEFPGWDLSHFDKLGIFGGILLIP